MKAVSLNPAPLETIERTLRDVIHDVLTDKFGPEWHRDDNVGLGSDWVIGLEEKMRADRGIQEPNAVYDIPLAYAEFRHLGELLKRNHGLFKPILGNMDAMLAYFWTAEKLRNAVQHHRDIGPTQQALLVGIAGEIEDAVNLWRIGSQLRVKRTVLEFWDGISVRYKPDTQVLTEAAECLERWQQRFWSAINASSLDPARFDETRHEKFEYHARGQHIEITLSTNDKASPTSHIEGVDYKGIHVGLKHNPACRASLDELLQALGKPYHHIVYELEDEIDVEALKRWSSERAGLNPSGSGSFNGELEDIGYSLLGGSLRIDARKFTERESRSGGALSATVNLPAGFWRAHNYIGARQLVGFMVGSITPSAMMHLVQMSRVSSS